MKAIEANPLWHIAGVGAVGTLVAAYFCAGEHDVHLMLKDEHQLETYKTNPLRVITHLNTVTCHPRATHIDHLGNTPIHYLICCVKAYDVTPLLMRLKPNLNVNSIIILMHNGLGVLGEIKTQLPELRIVFGLSTLGTYLEQPFTVRAFLDGAVHLGCASGQFTPDEISLIGNAFQAAHLPYQWEENIQAKMLEKFAINCSINLLTVLLHCKNGDLSHHDEMLQKITEEIAQALHDYQFCMTGSELLSKVHQVIRFTANNFSSMYKDVQHKKPTELKYLNEHLINLARQKKRNLPFNERLLKQFYAQFP